MEDTPISETSVSSLVSGETSLIDARVRELHERFPGVPFVALGQTVLWDEPMKAVLLDALRAHAPGTPLRISVMDTDYFAKPPVETEGHGEYALLPHNDTSTQNLWVATGELSRLFGCESVPSREMYRRHGVLLERVAQAAGEPAPRFLDRVTEAWGWLGLAHTGSRRTLAGEIPLSGALPTLLAQLRWGFGETADSLDDPDARQCAHAVTEGWIQRVEAYAEEHPNASLTDLYRFLLPLLVSALAGDESDSLGAPLETGGSMEFFRFNRATAESPQFDLLDLFLRPETRESARHAYNEAVRGSNIYTLDHFASGAIPFDLVIPGLGRGTIRIIPERVIIEMEKRVYLRIETPIQSARDLAEVLEKQLGRNVSLVGKALTLIAMLARSAVVVLNETGSTYIWRTRNMMEELCRRGVAFELHPILRLRFPTWESLKVIQADLRLPGHLSATFGCDTISARKFSERWKAVCGEQRSLMEAAKANKGPRGTIDFLIRYGNADWAERQRELDAHQETLLALRERLKGIERQVQGLYGEIRQLKAESEALAREKGEDFRQRVRPLQDELWRMTALTPGRSPFSPKATSAASISSDLDIENKAERIAALNAEIEAEVERRTAFDRRWEDLQHRLHEKHQEIRTHDRERQGLLKEEPVLEARRRLEELYLEAQAAKLEIVRNAFLTVEGLEHTEYRPAAWWLHLLSPDGSWFREIQSQTEAYLEPLSCCAPNELLSRHPHEMGSTSGG